MLRQAIVYLLLSSLVVFFKQYLYAKVVYIVMLYTWLNFKLAHVFSTSALGIVIRKTVTLVFIPLIIAAIIAILYRLIKGKQFTYFIEIVWFIWLLLVFSVVLIH